MYVDSEFTRRKEEGEEGKEEEKEGEEDGDKEEEGEENSRVRNFILT